ncbi:MAG: DUF4190 domain-containing protein [Actinomycetota bacterium]|nr:DUF4190 domain-containing protein [Actinomycetota bacterium]
MSDQEGNPPPPPGGPPAGQPPPPPGGYPQQAPQGYPPAYPPQGAPQQHYGYPSPGYAPPYPPAGYGPPPVQPPNNGYAVAALICSIVGVLFILPVIGPILGIVFGNTAKKQIGQSQGREGGENLAQAGVILGWIGIGLNVLVFLFFLVLIVGLFSFVDSTGEIIERFPTITPSP